MTKDATSGHAVRLRQPPSDLAVLVCLTEFQIENRNELPMYTFSSGRYGSSESYQDWEYDNPSKKIRGGSDWLDQTSCNDASIKACSTASDGSRPLRVVAVTPCLARGGAEQWLAFLTRFLNPQRARIVRTIVTNPNFVDPQFVPEIRSPVEIGQETAIRAAAQDCDVLLSWGIELGEWLNGCRPRASVYVAHGEGDWTKALVEKSAPYFDRLVAVSHRVRTQVCNGYPATVIRNGVDSSRLGLTQPVTMVRQALGFGSDDFVLGYVGRFSGEKRIDLIIDAVEELPANFKAMFVGWGPGRKELMDRANARIPGRYTFVKAANYLGDYYRAMDAMCLVSSEEGFSLAMLEAMMCQRPLIATAVGAVPEVIEDRINGLIVSGTPESIRDAAQRLHAHPIWARAVAREGCLYAEQHGHALRMAREYEDLFETLCK
jgi:glycosyltransferase involved in cell wall biosynthesis